MDDGFVVRRLVEALAAFFTENRTVEEDLTHALTSEFIQNMQDVLFTKQLVSCIKFKGFFADCFNRMLLCPEMYLKHLFYVCQQEALINPNIFERFLSVFALILRTSLETWGKSEIDFCKLAPDVFMVFYKKKLEQPFVRYGGYRRLVEIVNNPKYLELKCIARNVPCDPYASDDLELVEDSKTKINKMIQGEPRLHQSFNSEVAEVDPNCQSWAKEVLKIAKTKSILSPSDDSLMVNLSDSIQQDITPLDEKGILEALKEGVSKLAFECCPIMSSDSKTNDGAKAQAADDERYEKIIEAVIKHNSKSCHLKSKGRIYTKVDGILENLKTKINSLIQVLDEYDKE